MRVSSFARPASLAVYVATFAASFLCASAFAQDAESEQNRIPIITHVTEFDGRAAANNITFQRVHVTPAGTPGAREAVQTLNSQHTANASAAEAGVITGSIPSPTPPSFYGGDLVYSGGARVTTALSHAVYVDCTAVSTCWGNPEGFLTDLSKSSFIHLVDQYIGSVTNLRYPVGARAFVSYGFYGNTLYPHDIFAILHAVAKTTGTGYSHVYHVFLPKGVDTCFDQSNNCYSPDNPSNFFFCAYHGSVTFSDIGHVLYTVEPYQDVPGCAVATPSPNGQQADSTNSVLSHELFVWLSDPDGRSWFNRTSLDLAGFEIGDECQPLVNSSFDFLVPTFFINGKNYEVQTEYSNHYHACAVVP